MIANPVAGQHARMKTDPRDVGVIVGPLVPKLRHCVHAPQCPTCTCTAPDMPDGMWVLRTDDGHDFAVWPWQLDPAESVDPPAGGS